MKAPLTFGWNKRGSLTIQAPPEYNVLCSMLTVDLQGIRSDIVRLREFVERARTEPPTGPGYPTGDGYVVTVQGDQVLVESVLELFPDTTYPTDVFVDALDQLDRWLQDHATERPRP